VLRNLLGLMGGRVYYNLGSWYDCVNLMPQATQNREDMDRMMGVDADAVAVTAAASTITVRHRAVQALETGRLVAKVVPQLAMTDRHVRSFEANLAAFFARVRRDELAERSFGELMEVIHDIDRDLMRRWEAPILNDIRVMRATGSLRRFLAEHTDDEAQLDRLLSDLLSAIEGLASIEPTRRLLRLAALVRADASLTAIVGEGPPRAALEQACRHSPAFDAALAAYIDDYGDRCMGELKLETRTLREDPTFVADVLRLYLRRPDLDADSLARREALRFRVAREEALALLPPVRTRAFERRLRAARAAVKTREHLRLARTRVFGLVRSVYSAIGARLAESGQLDDPRDVFFLTVEEISAIHDGRSVTANLRGLVALRRADFAAFERLTLPDRFTTTGPASLQPIAAPPPVDGGVVLHGTGCFAGVVEAPAAVVSSPADAGSVEGCVIVAVRTDPGWAPLFPAATGLVVERGSTLSHSAVVARELGLPTVVGVPGATSIIESGELLRVDGGSGTVTRLGGS
jgi:rifampicin phosphotransferase